MIALLQRVSQAHVEVDAKIVSAIDQGLVVFIGIEKDDDQQRAQRLLERVLNYRVFNDAQGKMNLSTQDTKGELLFVPQFTLAADTSKGNRPSFSSAAEPAHSRALFTFFVAHAQHRYSKVASGIFGANMRVHLVNDGPATFWLKI